MNRSPITRLALLAAVLVALLLPAAASAGGGIVTIDVAKPGSAVRDYWTTARMRHADPVPATAPASPVGPAAAAAESGPPSYVEPAAADGSGGAELLRGRAAGTTSAGKLATPVLDPAAKGTRAHGKVFFTVKGGSAPGDYVCSGTAVNSFNKSVVWTAGHCVYDTQDGGGKSVNFMFVPAYDQGEAPYGTWTAKRLATTRQWKQGSLRFDLGAAVMRRNDGRRLQSVVGARGIGFNQPRDQNYTAFGYPALGIFTGELEYSCGSSSQGSDSPGGSGPNTMAISCNMTGGSSGGGWIVGRTLLSVTSYGYTSRPDLIYGPYLSQTAKKLYKRVR
jgi:hypothetical protein